MQHIINQIYNICHTFINGRTTLTNLSLLVIGICLLILLILLISACNSKSEINKALDSTRNAYKKNKSYSDNLLSQKQKVEQDIKKLTVQHEELTKKYNKSISDLKKTKEALSNLQDNYRTMSRDLEGKMKIINSQEQELKKIKQDLENQQSSHKEEFEHITTQMKEAYDTLDAQKMVLEKEKKSLAKEVADLKKKEEDANYVIASLQNENDQKGSYIVELNEIKQTLEVKIKEQENLLESKDAELTNLKEQLKLLVDKDNKVKNNPFERLANW